MDAAVHSQFFEPTKIRAIKEAIRTSLEAGKDSCYVDLPNKAGEQFWSKQRNGEWIYDSSIGPRASWRVADENGQIWTHLNSRIVRRSPDAPSFRALEARVGDEFTQYLEQWKKPYGDEDGVNKSRVWQVPLGRFRLAKILTKWEVSDTLAASAFHCIDPESFVMAFFESVL